MQISIATLIISATAAVLAIPTISYVEHEPYLNNLTFRNSKDEINLIVFDIPLDSHTLQLQQVGSCIPPHINISFFLSFKKCLDRVALTSLTK